ncbi:hypothetical protein M011DRAFT_269979 [Sporormia fimetaria CBS 119925]|uniref:Uncharacterized protein n=1 Tax=Sporormia fimetaria CBS 119925 TaxID=1340428 RepID=A0A6A6UZN5_9PLEO|nr:hypothetical protein M011DRAFT_269979 [Sporormia fimetaria CBS 119925]
MQSRAVAGAASSKGDKALYEVGCYLARVVVGWWYRNKTSMKLSTSSVLLHIHARAARQLDKSGSAKRLRDGAPCRARCGFPSPQNPTTLDTHAVDPRSTSACGHNSIGHQPEKEKKNASPIHDRPFFSVQHQQTNPSIPSAPQSASSCSA